MKFIDKIVQKFGTDKIMHFLVGAWITSLLSPFGWLGIMVGFLITLVLSFVKEKFLDSEFEYKDIFAGVCGSISSVLIYLIVDLLFI